MIEILNKFFPEHLNFKERAEKFQKNYVIGNQNNKEKQLVDFIINRILMDVDPLKNFMNTSL